MSFNMLKRLKNLRSRFRGKKIIDADILILANKKVKNTGRTSKMESFQDKSLSSGLFFLELLSAVEQGLLIGILSPRVKAVWSRFLQNYFFNLFFLFLGHRGRSFPSHSTYTGLQQASLSLSESRMLTCSCSIEFNL